jgi:hypothetical protein
MPRLSAPPVQGQIEKKNNHICFTKKKKKLLLRLFGLLKKGADIFKETALHYRQEGEAKDHELALIAT